MTDPLFSTPAALAHVHAGPLGPHMDHFASLLTKRGYAKTTLRKQLRGIADLGYWLEQQGLSVEDLDEQSLCRFEAQAPSGHEAFRKLRSACPILLAHLREIGVVLPREPSPPSSAIDFPSVSKSDGGFEWRIALY